PYLTATLERARGGARLEPLAAALVADDPEVTQEEAAGFVDELVEAQILVPELGVAVTGPEPIDGLLAPPARARGPRAAAAPPRGWAPPPPGAGGVPAGLEPLTAKVDIDRLFQVDMIKPAQPTL